MGTFGRRQHRLSARRGDGDQGAIEQFGITDPQQQRRLAAASDRIGRRANPRQP